MAFGWRKVGEPVCLLFVIIRFFVTVQAFKCADIADCAVCVPWEQSITMKSALGSVPRLAS